MNKMTMQEMIGDLLEKVRCPQTGSTDYGEWGALRLDLRLYLYEFAKRCQYYVDLDKDLDKFMVDTCLTCWNVKRGTPTKVLNKKKDIQFDTYSGTCPNCGWKLHNSVLERYCCSCGQNIDWRMTFER